MRIQFINRKKILFLDMTNFKNFLYDLIIWSCNFSTSQKHKPTLISRWRKIFWIYFENCHFYWIKVFIFPQNKAHIQSQQFFYIFWPHSTGKDHHLTFICESAELQGSWLICANQLHLCYNWGVLQSAESGHLSEVV